MSETGKRLFVKMHKSDEEKSSLFYIKKRKYFLKKLDKKDFTW